MFAKFHESIFPPPTLYTPPSSLWLICLYYRINICYDNHQVLGVCPHIHIYYIYSNIAEYVYVRVHRGTSRTCELERHNPEVVKHEFLVIKSGDSSRRRHPTPKCPVFLNVSFECGFNCRIFYCKGRSCGQILKAATKGMVL